MVSLAPWLLARLLFFINADSCSVWHLFISVCSTEVHFFSLLQLVISWGFFMPHVGPYVCVLPLGAQGPESLRLVERMSVTTQPPGLPSSPALSLPVGTSPLPPGRDSRDLLFTLE